VHRNHKQITYGVIYKLTSPSGKYYIGQTTNFKNRISIYKRLKCKTQLKLYNALLKYGFDKFNVEILFECNNIEDLNFYEKICCPISLVESGAVYNLKEGGGGYEKLSSEVKQKISIARTGTQIGSKNNQFGKRGILCPHYGYRHTNKSKLKMSNSKKGILNRNYGKIGINCANYKQSLDPIRDKIKELHLLNPTYGNRKIYKLLLPFFPDLKYTGLIHKELAKIK